MPCQKRGERKIEDASGGDIEMIREMKRQMQLHKYIGESSRSVFERAVKHQDDIHKLKTSSHMDRHLLEMHEGEERSGLIFGMRVLRFT